MLMKLKDCNTQHEKIEFLCQRWLDLADNEITAESGRDHMHGVWCTLMVYAPEAVETREMVDSYAEKCREKRDAFRSE